MKEEEGGEGREKMDETNVKGRGMEKSKNLRSGGNEKMWAFNESRKGGESLRHMRLRRTKRMRFVRQKERKGVKNSKYKSLVESDVNKTEDQVRRRKWGIKGQRKKRWKGGSRIGQRKRLKTLGREDEEERNVNWREGGKVNWKWEERRERKEEKTVETRE